MPLIQYVKRNFHSGSMERIQTANDIIEEYRAMGYDLSLRQVYYQHVARGLIPNTEKSYKTLGALISDARLSGLIDWGAIQDRTRDLRKHAQRTSSCQKITENRECLAAIAIQIQVGELAIEWIKLGEEMVADLEEFARSDGFQSVDAMHEFWKKFNGTGPFEGSFILWDCENMKTKKDSNK